MGNWLPHRWCINNEIWLMRLMVAGNLGIALAYFSIPFSLIVLIKRKMAGSIFGTKLFFLFSLFIFLCGATHLMDVVVLWQPMYLFQLIIVELTALVSIFTSVVLYSKLVEMSAKNGHEYRFRAHRVIEESNIPRLKEILEESQRGENDHT